jgi:hypothetical protein
MGGLLQMPAHQEITYGLRQLGQLRRRIPRSIGEFQVANLPNVAEASKGVSIRLSMPRQPHQDGSRIFRSS